MKWIGRSSPLRGTPAFLCLAFSCVPTAGHAQIAVGAEFVNSLNENGLTFRDTALKDYATTQIRSNPHMNYELAVTSKKLPLEIRYAIRRYDPSPKGGSVAPELAARAIFTATILNIARDNGILNSAAFEAKDVQSDFNAEWGSSALVIPKNEFARGFDRCMVVYIYRKRAGAFMFYLFNNQGSNAALQELGSVFTVLRFR